MTASRKRSECLAFMACPSEDFASFVGVLQRLDEGPWDLIAFYPAPCAVPTTMRVTVSTRSARVAAALWIRALWLRFRRVRVCCHDLNQPSALRSLIDFVSALPVKDREVVDGKGHRLPIPRASVASFCGLLAIPLLLFLATFVTRVGLKLAGAGRVQPVGTRGKTAILLPILPDLSHTFVYREALALKQRHPDYLVIALERGDASVVHREAADLLKETLFVPRPSQVGYLLLYLSAWMRRPTAMAALICFLQPYTELFGPGWIQNDAFSLLRLEHLDHSNYVMQGFILAEFLSRHRVTYIHVYGSTYPSVRTLMAHKYLGVPYSVSTFVDFDYVTPFHMLEEKFGAARFVVTCTKYCADRLTNRFPALSERFRVLHHAVPSSYAAHPQTRPHDGRSRLVYVGRFVPKKGLDTLVAACAHLQDWGVPFTCHLYGAGDERQKLEQMVIDRRLSETVFFEGPIPNERFYTTMNTDDVFVCPCRYMSDGERDGIPVTLLETLAAGLTAVATPVSGIPELIVDGYNGYLVPPDDPIGLAGRLRELLLNAGKRRAVGAAAKDTIQQGFRIELTSVRLDEWISREIESSAGTAARATAAPAESL